MKSNGPASFQELRGNTDKSLEDERDKTDEYLTQQMEKVEETTGEKVRTLRRVIDHVKESHRENVDLDKEQPLAHTDTPSAQLNEEMLVEERERADKFQAVERAAEDRVRAEERVQKQVLADALLDHERHQTDRDLRQERVRADLELITREQFLAIVSHDLKNPLVAISMDVHMMRQHLSKGDTDSLMKHLGRIQHSAATMRRMISDLLDVEGMAHGKFPVHLAKGDLRTLLQECGELFAPLVESQKFSLTIDTGSEPIMIDFDHHRILQVLSNLIGNSLKFTPNGGAIELSAHKHETHVEISVTDNGPGIPVEAQAHIFERFSQLNVADRQGLGLGLFIAKWIVEVHKGRIWVSSTPGNGCTFSFTIPLSV